MFLAKLAIFSAFLIVSGQGGRSPLKQITETMAAGSTICGDESLQIPKQLMMPVLKFGRKHYYLETIFKANYYKATRYCRYHNMNLVSIASQEELDKLQEYISNSGLIDAEFWTSGTDLDGSGEFFWMSTGLRMTFTNWNTGEPNNLEAEEERCVILFNRDGNLRWNNVKCSLETYFICEYSDE